MLVIGIDPGSSRTGYGLVSLNDGSLRYVTHGVIGADSRLSLILRLHRIHLGVLDVIERHQPDSMAIEAIFHAKNARSSLILGHARGVILLAAVQAGVDVYEYSALQIKQALTGYGRAGKEQTRAMVRALLSIRDTPPMDASDALAVAVCHSQSCKLHEKLGSLS